MKDDLHMDKMFREKFEDFSVEPSAHLWNNIQEQMISRRRKRRMAYIGWISAAAIVVFAFIAGWMLNERSGSITETVVEKQIPQEQKQNIEQVEPKNDLDVDEENALVADKNESIDHEDIESVTSANNSELVATAKIVSESEENVEPKRQLLNYDYLAATTIQFPVQPEELTLRTTAKEQETETSETVLPENERVLIAANMKNLNDEQEKGSKWILGAQLSPGYSAHSSSYSSEYSQNMSQVQNGGVSNVGGGISIQYKTSKRLSIESGVYYAQNSQSSGVSNSLFSAPMYESSFDMSMVADAPSYANNVSVTREGIVMNSTAGVVKMAKAPQGAELNAKSESAKDSYATTMVSDGDFSQVFDLVEIPVYLRYKVLDRKFGIDLLGGLNAGMVVGNNAYIENNYGRQNIGSTEDISTLNLSGTVGVGFNYDLGRHFSLAMEPRFNYFLNSINSNPEIDYKPYRFGLFTGIYYAF